MSLAAFRCEAIFVIEQFMNQPRNFTLGRAEMLKSRKKMDLIFRQGKNFSTPPLRVYFMVDKEPAPAGEKCVKVGVGAGKKHFKRAVDRNRIKRLMREAYRLNKSGLLDLAAEKNRQLSVFFLYTGKELPDYKLIEEKMIEMLSKLTRRINEIPV